MTSQFCTQKLFKTNTVSPDGTAIVYNSCLWLQNKILIQGTLTRLRDPNNRVTNNSMDDRLFMPCQPSDYATMWKLLPYSRNLIYCMAQIGLIHG